MATSGLPNDVLHVDQVYCYTETRIIKAFPQILKVLYNEDCISDQAIIYWAQKGASAQGKGHFIKAAEPLVKVSKGVANIAFDTVTEQANARNPSFSAVLASSGRR
jgi:hypothetical protein